MAYDEKKGFGDFEREVGMHGRNLMQTVKLAEELYQDLLVYKGTMSNAEMATKLGVPDVAWIDDLGAALVAMHNIHEYAEGNSQVAGDHFDAIRKFT